MTPALRVLISAGVEFEQHLYDYEPRGGTRSSSAALVVDEHCVIKTLVMEGAGRGPFLVLMHGDLQVSARQLGRALGLKQLRLCDPKEASKQTGYQVGGTSPFGTRRDLEVYAEESILELERLYINGGRRGLLVSMRPAVLRALLDPKPVRCGVPS